MLGSPCPTSRVSFRYARETQSIVELRIDNPLTYFERARLLSAALTHNGVSRDRFEILPFPIENPAELPDFLPTSIPVVTTIYDDWNRAKIESLQSVGYRIENLWTRSDKRIQGREIRRLIRTGSPRMASYGSASHGRPY